MSIYWQVKMEDGSILRSGPKIKLPQENVKEIYLISSEFSTLTNSFNDKVKVSCEVKGKPFYFCRHFASISFETTHREEHHIGHGSVEYIYLPATDEVINVVGNEEFFK